MLGRGAPGIYTPFVFQDTQEKDKAVPPERAEEAKLKAKYPNLGQKPGGSDFLMKRLQKGVCECLSWDRPRESAHNSPSFQGLPWLWIPPADPTVSPHPGLKPGKKPWTAEVEQVLDPSLGCSRVEVLALVSLCWRRGLAAPALQSQPSPCAPWEWN